MGKAHERRHATLALVRRHYERGNNKVRVLGLFRSIAWPLALPPATEREVWRAIEQLEEERQMPYISSVGSIGIEQGRLEEACLAAQQGGEKAVRDSGRRPTGASGDSTGVDY